MAGGALINALAFSGTNAAFSLLGDHGGLERKRHDVAMERLSKAREDWNRDRQERLDLINKALSDQRHAKQTFSDLGIAMREYSDRLAAQHEQVTSQSLPPLRDPPKLADFYNPSRQRKDAEIALVVGGMAVVGALAYKFSE